jgi:hypothetical protein
MPKGWHVVYPNLLHAPRWEEGLEFYQKTRSSWIGQKQKNCAPMLLLVAC